MSTESSIQKSPISRISRWLLLALIVIVFIILVLNLLLFFSREKIVRIVNAYFPTQVSVMHVYSLRPDEIVLKNVFISNDANKQDHTFLFPKMTVRLPVIQSLKTKTFLIDEVIIDNPALNGHGLLRYLDRHALAIKVIVDSLPKNDLAIRVRGSKINLAVESAPSDILKADLFLLVEHPSIRLEGKFSHTDSKNKLPLSVLFEGDSQPGEFFIRKIDLKGQHVNSNLWGQLKGNTLSLNGFLIFDLFSKVGGPGSKPSTGSGRINPEQSVYLLDLESRMILAPPKLVLESLRFKVNNKSVAVNGNALLGSPVKFQLTATHANEKKLSESVVLRKANFSISGRSLYRRLVFDSKLKLDYEDKRLQEVLKSSVTSDFKNAAIAFNRGSQLQAGVGHLRVVYSHPDLEQILEVNNIVARYNSSEEKLDVVDLQSPFYGGQLAGRVWIDSKQYPTKFTTVLWVKEAEANQLKSFYPHFKKIYGKFDSKIHIQNLPKMDIIGEMSISEGRLVHFEFFEWLGERFRLESLLDLHFDKVSSEFYLNPSGSGLTNIFLDASGVRLKGNYEVSRTELVTSKIGLTFTKDQLRESPKFVPLLKLFDEDRLQFDFQLSGKQSAMNFQWLNSEVKRRIQDRIPDFIERHIERKIDEGLVEQQAEQENPVVEPQINITVGASTPPTDKEGVEGEGK